jgi:nucleotide-binding universal stress UspA family protein
MKELFKSILCPVDLDELYIEAPEFSRDLPQQNNAKLDVLNIASEFGSDHGWEAGSRASLRRHAPSELQGKVAYEFVVRTGEAVSEILAAVRAFESDLIVIPTDGRRGLRKLMLGSVTERVVRESPVPVLTLRAY